MIDIRLLNHGTHRMLNRPIGKFIMSMLLPDMLQIKIWPPNLWFEKLKVPRMRDGLHIIVKVLVERCCERMALCLGIEILDAKCLVSATLCRWSYYVL